MKSHYHAQIYGVIEVYSQASGARTAPGSPTVQEFFEAASERVERAKSFPSHRMELARSSPDSDVRFAASLYEVAVGIQRLDLKSAQRGYEVATGELANVTDPLLRWWFYHLSGSLHMEKCRFGEAEDAFRGAIDVATQATGLTAELEKSKTNLLLSLCGAGNAPAVATELLRLVRDNESSELESIFYQIASFVLYWLGEYEFAYSLRSHGMQTADLTPARLARDQREFARILIALDRLDEAEFHLRSAFEWIENGSADEAIRTIETAVKWAVARGDITSALQFLEDMRAYGSPGQHHEQAVVTTGELLVELGDIDAAESLLDSVDPDRTTPSMQPKILSLRAEIAARRGDHKAALGLFRRAADSPQLALAPAETIVAICREVSPWLSTNGPDSLFTPVVESRFFDGSHWLMAAARDIRRSMAPSWLALESDIGPEAKLEVLKATVDDLNLLGSFLADGAGPADSRVPDDFWTLHPVASRVVQRSGATLQTEPELGAPLHQKHPGLAGRMAFGLIAIVVDHASAGSELELRVDDHGFVIEASAMTSFGLARMENVLNQLCAPLRARNVILPSRASFVATYRAALSLGWSVDVSSGADGATTISVVFANRCLTGDERYLFAASPAMIVEPQMAPGRPQRPSSNPELVAQLAEYHDRRLEAPEFDLALLDVARASEDIDLLASTLLVAASAELWLGRRQHASDLLGELNELIDTHPHLRTDLWPAPLFAKNREYWLNSFKGDVPNTWISATENMLEMLQAGTLDVRMIGALNWATAEIERGELASAWLFSNMCDPTRTSEQGRLLELRIHNHVLLAEGRFDEAVPVAQELLALAHAADFASRASALKFHARTMSVVGRFGEAWASVNEYAELDHDRQSPLVEALAASVLWAEGRHEEAYVEAVSAREHEDFAYGAPTLSISVPIEAEGLLARGEPEAAQRLLDSFPIGRQQFLDLPHRLDIEDRVAAALDDHDRQLEIGRELFALRSGQPRWDARKHPIYYKFWRAMEAAVRNDRQRIEAEQAAVAAVVTHDLRNSLTAVTLAAELAAINPGDEILERSGQALEPIRSLAGQLDAVAQWDGASRVAGDDLVEIDELLDSVEFPNKSAYELSGGVLEVRSDLPDGLAVPTKRNMLAIILSNLVGNAIKHGRRDGVVRVSATSCADDDNGTASVIIAVDDDGPGMSDQQAARLRDRSKTPVEPGRGLGLWIVRRYAAALGLPVVVGTSTLGGTRVAVHIKLPEGGVEWQSLGAAATAETVSVSTGIGPSRFRAFRGTAPRRSRRVAAGGRPGDDVIASATHHRVLVVEDDAFLSALIVELLIRQNKKVATATTASEAIHLLAHDTFDIVLTDVDLADGSTGYEVLASIFDQGLEPGVIVMSGQAIEQTRMDLLRQFGSPVPVLQKPFTLEDLYVAVGS